MCQIYSGTEPELYQCVSRSVRINGVVTSLRLELRFWQILDEISAGEGFSTPQFLGKIYDEVVAQRGDIPNFASLLRVICTVYLEKQIGLHTTLNEAHTRSRLVS
ncbi:ribbon-helix-helix domain-containing protein [Thalassospira povalilytica]|uniref:ribbon-helix-helix domain-containing protein n=1 Tax=Thalassospira povalilytica TaxID=732237 RepID=UPI001D17E7EC|nr:ribbon-helix-helix domain-containing protein [Thalassospira povalilytica]MCC4241605.1 ribbon-helix-helix domain-containing protein [Thalassospira povalilytica]